VHAEAFGAGGSRRIVEASIARQASGADGAATPADEAPTRLIDWREIKWGGS